MNSAPEHIIILGGGTAGWMAANLMMHRWGRYSPRISLIESTKLGTVGVGEGSTPYLKEFFDTLGIPESTWMPACNATYKCGIRFPGWCTKPGYESYFHPFYSDQDGPQAKQFFSLCNERRNGTKVRAHPDDFFVSAALAEQSRAPKYKESELSEPVYAYHFDAELLGRFLRTHALESGVNHIDDQVTQVVQDKQGDIAILHTQTHGPLRGDLFVDCSGFKGLLIQQTLGEELISYKKQLFNDSAVAIQTDIEDCSQLSSETVSKALKHGWVWQIPLHNRFGNGYVYCSDYINELQAEQELRELLGDKADGKKALHLHWTPGRIEQHWKQNCVAIGLSQGFLEPLEAPMLFIVQKSIERFIDSFEQSGFNRAKQPAYNQEINNMIDGTRDYLQAHYALNTREDTAYWRDNRNNQNRSNVLNNILVGWNSKTNFDQVLHDSMDKLAYLKTSWYCMLAGKAQFGVSATSEHDQISSISQLARSNRDKEAGHFALHRAYLDSIYTLNDQKSVG